MKILNSILSVCLLTIVTTTVSAQQLTWSQLVQHPELWPSQCKLKHGFDFQSGASVEAGQTVAVLAIHADSIEVGTVTGKAISFDVKPDDTDVLVAAQDAYAKLTPKQRALTYAAIFQNKDLWPYRLTLKASFDLGGGRRVNKGDSMVFFSVKNGQLEVGSEKFDTRFSVEPGETDLMEQARKFVENPASAPSRLLAELQPNLINSATGRPAPIDTNVPPRYFVFVRAANFCPITQRFMPSLVKFDDANKTTHPDYKIIYLSCDANATDMEKFAKTEGFSWPAVSYQRSGYLFQVMPYFKPPIPQVTVMDARGHVLVSGVGEVQNGEIRASASDGGTTAVSGGKSAADALKEFAALLAKSDSSK